MATGKSSRSTGSSAAKVGVEPQKGKPAGNDSTENTVTRLLEEAAAISKSQDYIQKRNEAQSRFLVIPGIGYSTARKLVKAGHEDIPGLREAGRTGLVKAGLEPAQVQCIIEYLEHTSPEARSRTAANASSERLATALDIDREMAGALVESGYNTIADLVDASPEQLCKASGCTQEAASAMILKSTSLEKEREKASGGSPEMLAGEVKAADAGAQDAVPSSQGENGEYKSVLDSFFTRARTVFSGIFTDGDGSDGPNAGQKTTVPVRPDDENAPRKPGPRETASQSGSSVPSTATTVGDSADVARSSDKSDDEFSLEPAPETGNIAARPDDQESTPVVDTSIGVTEPESHPVEIDKKKNIEENTQDLDL